MEQEKIDRINVLARKSKAEGLTEAEKKEQELLRQEYIATIRRNLRAQLITSDVINPDPTTVILWDKYNRKSED